GPADAPSGLEPESTAGGVARLVQPVSPDLACETVQRVFVADPSLHVIPVVNDDGVPVGLLNRFKVLKRLSSRYCHPLSTLRMVREYMEPSPLVVDESASLDQLGALLVTRDNRYVFDGFIVTRDGKYAGIATGFDLMRALTDRRHAELVRLAHHDVLTG